MMTLNRAIFIYLFIIRIRILDGGGVNFLRFRDRNESAGRCHSCHIQRIFKSFSDLIWRAHEIQNKKQNRKTLWEIS